VDGAIIVPPPVVEAGHRGAVGRLLPFQVRAQFFRHLSLEAVAPEQRAESAEKLHRLIAVTVTLL
jgi:hypothetical protein